MSEGRPTTGDDAPDFDVVAQDGQAVRLKDLHGQWVVLYFYPRDETPGCTREACSFRDHFAEIQAAGATVLGVSGDTQASHAKFAAKHGLPFRLLVDTADHAVARAYGAWGLKKNYGKEYEGITRSTFVITPDGKVAKVFPRVKPDAHGAEVLEWLKAQATAPLTG